MLKRIYDKLPICNFVISSTALFFQIAVLNPWHGRLSKEFTQLKHQLDTIEDYKLSPVVHPSRVTLPIKNVK